MVGIRRKTWLWPTATLSLGATSLALALALFLRSNSPPQVVYVERPAPATSPRIATLPEPSPPPEPAPEVAVTPQSALRPAAVRVPADNYLRSRDVALRMGLDALGGPRASGGGSAAGMTYLDWLAGLDRETSRGDQPAGAPRVDSALPQM